MNVFLHKVYERQLEENDKGFRFQNLEVCPCRSQHDLDLNELRTKLIEVMGEILNDYHALNETPEFWEKLLHRWVRDYIFSIYFKIVRIQTLQKQYPQQSYVFHSYAYQGWNEDNFSEWEDSFDVFVNDRYHFFSYLWIAKYYYNFHIDEIAELDCPQTEAVQSSELLNKSESKFQRIIRIVSHVNWDKIKRFVFLRYFESKMKVGIFSVVLNPDTMEKWLIRSKGKIRALSIPMVNANAPIDSEFRNLLPRLILRKVPIRREYKAIIELLPKVFPSFFVEQFKKHYSNAGAYLKAHPDLSVIFSATGVLANRPEKICMLLLQKRGGQIWGQQHGGNYQISRGLALLECHLNDRFYFWGKGALDYRCRKNVINYAPCYKLAKYDYLRTAEKRNDYILFVGTSVYSYPRKRNAEILDIRQQKYLDYKITFFSLVDGEIRKRIIPREYYVDFGWHVSQQLKKDFPDLLFLDNPFSSESFATTNTVLRDSDFSTMLCDCGLFITDHLSTTWLEALYLNKPTIIFLNGEDKTFIKKEMPYFNSLRNAKILFYSPEEAAEMVNQIYPEGISAWWMDRERQEVLQKLKDRWMTKVEDIDDWWYNEFATTFE